MQIPSTSEFLVTFVGIVIDGLYNIEFLGYVPQNGDEPKRLTPGKDHLVLNTE